MRARTRRSTSWRASCASTSGRSPTAARRGPSSSSPAGRSTGWRTPASTPRGCWPCSRPPEPRRAGRRDGPLRAAVRTPRPDRRTLEVMATEITEDRRGVARGADARAVPRPARGGHRARLHRQVLGQPRRRRVPLRGLRRRAVRLDDEVRVRLRLAELHRAQDRRGDRDAARHLARDAPHRGRVQALRRPPRPRLRRRARATRAACATASTRALARPRASAQAAPVGAPASSGRSPESSASASQRPGAQRRPSRPRRGSRG